MEAELASLGQRMTSLQTQGPGSSDNATDQVWHALTSDCSTGCAIDQVMAALATHIWCWLCLVLCHVAHQSCQTGNLVTESAMCAKCHHTERIILHVRRQDQSQALTSLAADLPSMLIPISTDVSSVSTMTTMCIHCHRACRVVPLSLSLLKQSRAYRQLKQHQLSSLSCCRSKESL